MRTADTIVIGAGIVGCACAYYLSEAGLRVLVIEKGPIGGGATAAGMGHVVVMDDSPAQFALTHYSQELWNSVYESLPERAEPRITGTLWVATDSEELAGAAEKQKSYASYGLPSEMLDEQALRRAEPCLKHGLAGGLRVPGDSVIFPMVAAKWLLDRAIERGTGLIHGRSVVEATNGSVTLDNGDVLEAHSIVNAAGDHAHLITPSLEIEPRKGHLVITDRYPGTVHHQLVELGYLKSAHQMTKESVAFNAQPRATGQILLGSSRQFVGWDPTVDHRILAQMIQRASTYLPELMHLNAIRVWTGFRATTKNKLPLIGRLPSDPSLIIAAGHEGLGITTSMGTGRLVADIAVSRDSAIDRGPYSPDKEEQP